MFKKICGKIHNWYNNISDYTKGFFDGMIFLVGSICIILNLLFDEYIKIDKLQNISLIINFIGFIILFYYFIRAIISTTNASKIDCGYFWLPLFLVLFPTFFIEKNSVIANLFSVGVAIFYTVYIIIRTPIDNRYLIIDEWKWSSAWIAVIGAGFLFIYYLMPKKIGNIDISFIRNQIPKVLCSSVFIYAIIKFAIAYLEHKKSIRQSLSKDNSKNQHQLKQN